MDVLTGKAVNGGSEGQRALFTTILLTRHKGVLGCRQVTPIMKPLLRHKHLFFAGTAMFLAFLPEVGVR